MYSAKAPLKLPVCHQHDGEPKRTDPHHSDGVERGLRCPVLQAADLVEESGIVNDTVQQMVDSIHCPAVETVLKQLV